LKKVTTTLVVVLGATLALGTSCKKMAPPTSHRPLAEACPTTPRPPGYDSHRDGGAKGG
jgi:hypothetical protein